MLAKTTCLGRKPMPRSSQAWKNLERSVAKELGGKRKLRGADFSESDTDVEVKQLPFLKIDAKYRKNHSHHSLLQEIEDKYCKEDVDVPVLVTKHHKQRGSYTTVPTWFFALAIKALCQTNIDEDLPDVIKAKVLLAKNKLLQEPRMKGACPTCLEMECQC